MSKDIRENSFDGAPGGLGSQNYQAPIGNHVSPEVYQDPNKFNSADDQNHVGNHSNTRKDNVGGPKDLLKKVDQIYSQKIIPSADEVRAGLNFELSNMIKPDKARAKEMVLNNLRKDPKYYGDLHMLNIDDDAMQVNMKENAQFEATKNILDQMQEERNPKKEPVPNADAIAEAMRQTMENRKQVRKWQKGDPTL